MNLEAENTIFVTTSSNDTSINTSNETFYSPESSVPSNSTVSPEKSITPKTSLSHVPINQQQMYTTSNSLHIRYNDIAFLRKINSRDKTPKEKPIYIISSVRPSFSCSKDHDYFLCHLCHSLPKNICYNENEWKEDNNEYPFVRNIGSIWKHIYTNHC